MGQDLISEELKIHAGLTEKNVVVFGLSQGGVIAQATGLLNEKSYGGLVVLSSWVSEAVKSTVESGGQFHVDKGLKVYIGHGLYDQLVYPINGKNVAGLLSV